LLAFELRTVHNQSTKTSGTLSKASEDNVRSEKKYSSGFFCRSGRHISLWYGRRRVRKKPRPFLVGGNNVGPNLDSERGTPGRETRIKTRGKTNKQTRAKLEKKARKKKTQVFI